MDDLYKTKLESASWFVLSGIEKMIGLNCLLHTGTRELIPE